MKRYSFVAMGLVVTSALSGCASNGSANKTGTNPKPAVGESSTLKPSNTQSTIKNVSVDEAIKLISDKKDLVILDVRTEEEYKSDHLKNALLMPYDQINNRIAEIEKYKDKPVLVYCRSGNRSAVASQTLEKKGFKNIYHMNQGIVAWKGELVK